jgi:hypothetical protein
MSWGFKVPVFWRLNIDADGHFSSPGVKVKGKCFNTGCPLKLFFSLKFASYLSKQ